MSASGTAAAERPLSATSAGKRKAEWMEAGGDGVKIKPRSREEILKKEETRQAVSSIKSKLSAPKLDKGSKDDGRKSKIGSFSAGLTREQIHNSQSHHREKMIAYGKPIPQCVCTTHPLSCVSG